MSPLTPSQQDIFRDSALARRELRQLAFMESYDAHSPIATAIQDSGVYATSIHLVSVQHRPGAGVTGIYRVATGRPVVPRGHGHGAYRETSDHVDELYVGMTTEDVSDLHGELIRSHCPYGPLTIWQHPLDPGLPGLRLATDPKSVAAVWGEGRQLVALETVSYRPLRRAVIAADFADGLRLYLKVLRAGQGEVVDARHRMLMGAGVPTARPIREPVDDVVALVEGPGEPLAEYFLADGGDHVDPQIFIDMMDRIPHEVMTLPARESWTDRLSAYASAAAAALPDCASRIHAVESMIEAELPLSERGEPVPTHGDLYEANVLMLGTEISCVLDVDALGPGYRIDDLACFLGHLAVLPAVDERYVHAPAALQRFARVFGETVDPRGLRARSAAVALSLVAGARDSRMGSWEEQAQNRLRCAESLLGLTAAEHTLPQWPADTLPISS